MVQSVERWSARCLAYRGAKELVTRSPAGTGFFLTESDLAARLGVSRTPVREALLMLEAEGLLQLVPHRGAYVPAISDREVVEVMEARMLIETFSGQRVAEQGSDIVPALHELLAQQERLLDDVDGFIDCDRAFHCAIVDAAGHHIFSGVYESLRDRQLRMGIRALLSSRARAQQVISEHRAIADALAARDRDLIATTVERHVRETLDALQVARTIA